MAGHRFETLLRTMTARSRRQLLQGLVAGGAASLAPRLGVVPIAGQVVSTDSGETCSQDSDCMVAEADPCTGTYCDAGSCSYTSVHCMPGYDCCGNGECCPVGDEATSAEESDGEGHPSVVTTSEPTCSASH